MLVRGGGGAGDLRRGGLRGGVEDLRREGLLSLFRGGDRDLRRDGLFFREGLRCFLRGDGDRDRLLLLYFFRCADLDLRLDELLSFLRAGDLDLRRDELLSFLRAGDEDLRRDRLLSFCPADGDFLRLDLSADLFLDRERFGEEEARERERGFEGERFFFGGDPDGERFFSGEHLLLAELLDRDRERGMRRHQTHGSSAAE